MRVRFVHRGDCDFLADELGEVPVGPRRRSRSPSRPALGLTLEDERDYLAGESLADAAANGRFRLPREVAPLQRALVLAVGTLPAADVVIDELVPDHWVDVAPYRLWLSTQVAGEVAAIGRTQHEKLSHYLMMQMLVHTSHWALAATTALGMSQEMLPELEHLASAPASDSDLAVHAAWALAGLGTANAGIEAMLRDAASDPSATPESRAIAASAYHGAEAPDPGLSALKRIADSSAASSVRREALVSLVRMGTTDPETIDVLRAVIADTTANDLLRDAAAAVIEDIPEVGATMQALAAEPSLPSVLVENLTETASMARELVRVLQDVLVEMSASNLFDLYAANEDLSLMVNLLREELAERVTDDVPCLSAILDKLAGTARRLAEQRSAVPDNDLLRLAAAEAIADLGAIDHKTVLLIRELADDSAVDPVCREAAAMLLARIGARTVAVASLRGLAADPAVLKEERMGIGRRLAMLGGGEAASAVFGELAADAEVGIFVRHSAVKALGELARSCPEARRTLLALRAIPDSASLGVQTALESADPDLP